jgi:hypothetical protein
MTREQRINDEIAALWQEVFGGPPPPKANGAAMLQIITGALPEVGYERMLSPHLRPSVITEPKTAKRDEV